MAPGDARQIFVLLGRLAEKVDDLFTELADHENNDRERHKETLAEIRRAGEKRLSA